LIASFTGSDPTSAAERSGLLTASTTTIAGFTVGAILTWFASRWFGETRLFKSAVLSAALAGAHDTPVLGEVRVPSAGSLGVADTDLRPSGRARFGNDLIDAQSTGDYIARGVTIRVVSRMGSSVVVEALLTNESNTP
jgi:membrane-bound ClpP family serine protease